MLHVAARSSSSISVPLLRGTRVVAHAAQASAPQLHRRRQAGSSAGTGGATVLGLAGRAPAPSACPADELLPACITPAQHRALQRRPQLTLGAGQHSPLPGGRCCTPLHWVLHSLAVGDGLCMSPCEACYSDCATAAHLPMCSESHTSENGCACCACCRPAGAAPPGASQGGTTTSPPSAAAMVRPAMCA